MNEAGKGDTPRPIVDRSQFEASWDVIFGKKEKPKVHISRKIYNQIQEVLDKEQDE